MVATHLPLGQKNLPKPMTFRQLIGPSFIILGLGLGSGEVILWPFLASNYGLGMVWAMAVGISMQFLINMEVERYALVRGESIFVGFMRLWQWLPIWFIFSTFLGFGWPGIGLAGATLLSQACGIANANLLGVGIFIAIGAILTLGTVLYKTVETLQKYLISIGVPAIVILTFWLAEPSDIAALGAGLIGRGEGFVFLPVGIVIGQFLGAIAYAGAGGNLNLAQSFYVRDKGYGMGKYSDRITSVITGKGARKSFSLTGNTFPLTEENLKRFRKWWRIMNIEHLLIFWALGLFTMLTLALLAYVTVFGMEGNEVGIQFVIHEALVIGQRTVPMIGTFFLIVTGIMLCATQMTVLDSTSRIMTENVLLMGTKGKSRVSAVYYTILWLQILFGITVFLLGFDQPLTLITLGASLNAFTMFSYIGLLLFVSNRMLPKPLRPHPWRTIGLTASFIFFGFFCYLTIIEQFA